MSYDYKESLKSFYLYMRQCAEGMSQPTVKVTLEGQIFDPAFRVGTISSTFFETAQMFRSTETM